MSFHMFERTNLLPHTLGHYIPTFAQLHHLCAKINAVAFNPAHTWTIWPTTNNPPPTTLHTTLLTLNTSILSPNISSEGWQTFAQLSTVGQELSSCKTDENWTNNKQNKVRGAKTHNKKLSSQPYTPSLSYNMSTLVLSRSPPSATLSFHNMYRFGGAQCAKTNNSSSNAVPTTKEGGLKFFFPQPTVFEIFLVVKIEKHCSIVFLSFYVSKLFPNIIYYNKASFIFSFSFFFPLLLIFVDNVIYFFVSMHLCIELTISLLNFVPVSI